MGLVCFVHEPLFLFYLAATNWNDMNRLNIQLGYFGLSVFVASLFMACSSSTPSIESVIHESDEQAGGSCAS